MRSHSQIITDGGGPAAVSLLVGSTPGATKQWRRTDSIPAPYWQAFADRGLATLRELAAAAAARISLAHDTAAPVDDSVTVAPDASAGAGAKTAIVQ